MIDLKQIKLKYERFGESLEDLAEANDFSFNALKDYASMQGWQKQEIVPSYDDKTTSNINTIQELNSSINDHISNKIQCLKAQNQETIYNKLVELETAILDKTIVIAKGLDTVDKKQSLSFIKSLLSTLSEISNRHKYLAEETISSSSVDDVTGFHFEVVK